MDSTEISTKIRAAIKAKLEELGAYADEELPDYIMVMVANKKTRSQMTEDLNLFLGKNAPIFTKWLHEVLERLSALSKGAPKAAAPAATKDPKPKEKKKDSKEETKKKEPKKTTKGKEEKATKPKEPRKSDENAAPSSSKQVDEILHIHADENDELVRGPEERVEKRRRSPPEPRREPAKAISKDKTPTKDRRRISPPRRRHSRSRSPIHGRRGPENQSLEEYQRRRERPAHPREREMRRSRSREREPAVAPRRPRPSSRERSRTLSPPRVRPAPRRRDDYEEYDPLNPDIHPVASTVSKPASRPRYPASDRIKPEGNVFLRAVKDATKLSATTVTITQSTKRPHREEEDEEPVEPVTRRARRMSPLRVSVKDRLGGRIARLNSRSRSPSPDLAPTSTKPKENLVIGLGGGDRRRVQIDEGSEDDEAPVLLPGPEPSPPGEDGGKDKEPAPAPAPAAKKADPAPPPDDAVEIFLAPTIAEAVGGPRFTVTMEGVEEEFRSRLEKRLEASEDCEIEANTGRRKHLGDPNSSLESITTDSSTTTTTTTSDDSLRRNGDIRGRLGQLATVGFPLPDTSIPPPPLPFIPSVAPPGTGAYLAYPNHPPTFRQVGLDDNSGPKASPPLRPHTNGQVPAGVKPQKCRFWPKCVKDNCTFVHPTKLCSNFPTCRYGDACLFIHPMCKYGGKCTRANCAFTHPAIKGPASPTHGGPKEGGAGGKNVGTVRKAVKTGLPECRFRPCKNANCKFQHTPACKWGVLCTRSDCIYWHAEGRGQAGTQMPPLPPPKGGKGKEGDKFKWSKKEADSGQEDTGNDTDPE